MSNKEIEQVKAKEANASWLKLNLKQQSLH